MDFAVSARGALALLVPVPVSNGSKKKLASPKEKIELV
jgi:hypothetical protein